MDAVSLDAVMGPILTALGAIGHKALSDVEDQSAGDAVRVGQRLLNRLLRRGQVKEPARAALEAAAVDVVAEPQEDDVRSALRAQVRKALSGADNVRDPELGADLEAILKIAGIRAVATGAVSVAVGHNAGIISTGDWATNTISRDRM